MDNSNGPTGVSPADPTRRIKDSATTVVDRAKHAASQQLGEGAQRVTDSAHNAASALRRAADDVQSENDFIGVALRKTADTIDRATQSFSGGDLNRTLEDLNGFARRQPALFLGASFALGFAVARIGKTAVERSASNGLDQSDQSVMPGL